ncbi:MAG TPA: glycoside hydrolase family 30 beta sandwich domain-containing protein [Bacteroidota bacterium]|nr:glycoside hydrolase family 30 beta sandwich domain-containing protein [Bacteroidota bacterium]
MSKSSVPNATLYISTANSFFNRQSLATPVDAAPDITVYPKKRRQMIEGFGGCFNEKGWEALSVLGANDRHQVMQQMFHPSTGLGFTICRVPIGTNDYSIDRYSLNETPNDFEMKHFSIERDKLRIIPYIKEAMSIQPNLRLWGSAWTPPTWMKDNKSFDSGNFLDQPEIYKAYALYLLKFIQSYRQEGLPVEVVAVQNEPGTLTNYPSCDWTPVQYLTFIRDYLGPLFEKEKVNDAIMLGTFNQPKLAAHALTVLLDPKARRFIALCGMQWYSISFMDQLKVTAPGLTVWQTETDCGNWFWLPNYNPNMPQNDFVYAGFTWEKIRDWFKAGVTVYELWNMVLHPDGKSIDSKDPWPQNSLITIDPETHNVCYTPLFGAIGCFSKFVKPGSFMVEAEGIAADADFISFVDPDGNVLVVMYNRKETAVSLKVEVCHHVFAVTLPPQSFSTLVVK